MNAGALGRRAQPGGQPELPSAQQMDVQMKHRLTTMAADVGDQSVAVFVQTKLLGDLRRGEEKRPSSSASASEACATDTSGLRGITSTCVGATGWMSRNATT